MAAADVISSPHPATPPTAPQPGTLPEAPDHRTEREILDRAARGVRLSGAEALYLLEYGDLTRIGEVADAIRRRRFPEGYATFIIDRNINYTNACVIKCSFCAFYRLPGHPEAYRRSKEEIFQRIEEALDKGATQIMFQGGHDPKLTITYYEDLLAAVKARYPVTLHSLSPSEVHHIARYSRLSLAETLRRLRAAGLDSLPGGGAEILSERVKRAISPLKNSAAAWIEIMDEAHRQGIRTTATMMLGHVETLAERVEHFQAVRDSQDRALTEMGTGQGYRAFIPWTYQPDNTDLAATAPQRTTSEDYLKTLAVSRLFFDNIDHVQGSWLTVGKRVGQQSLALGADDLGSIMLEENVVSAAGVTEKCMTDTEMIELIREAGRIPALRDTLYRVLQTF
ncbi:MAG TPA: cyclic dehypoxanthinyl futalosine synthase [Chloroflexota bacterium]|nr:cyclic dehypoxanthinyl futalosine synthase [Chloroflexota bacterium]